MFRNKNGRSVVKSLQVTPSSGCLVNYPPFWRCFAHFLPAAASYHLHASLFCRHLSDKLPFLWKDLFSLSAFDQKALGLHVSTVRLWDIHLTIPRADHWVIYWANISKLLSSRSEAVLIIVRLARVGEPDNFKSRIPLWQACLTLWMTSTFRVSLTWYTVFNDTSTMSRLN